MLDLDNDKNPHMQEALGCGWSVWTSQVDKSSEISGCLIGVSWVTFQSSSLAWFQMKCNFKKFYNGNSRDIKIPPACKNRMSTNLLQGFLYQPIFTVTSD